MDENEFDPNMPGLIPQCTTAENDPGPNMPGLIPHSSIDDNDFDPDMPGLIPQCTTDDNDLDPDMPGLIPNTNDIDMENPGSLDDETFVVQIIQELEMENSNKEQTYLDNLPEFGLDDLPDMILHNSTTKLGDIPHFLDVHASHSC